MIDLIFMHHLETTKLKLVGARLFRANKTIHRFKRAISSAGVCMWQSSCSVIFIHNLNACDLECYQVVVSSLFGFLVLLPHLEYSGGSVLTPFLAS